MSSEPRYEIFQKLPSKQPTWVETAADLDEAKTRLKELDRMFPASYFILDCEHSIFIIPLETAGAKFADAAAVSVGARA